MPVYLPDSGSCTHGANTFLLLASVAFRFGKCLPSTSFIPLFCTQLKPTLVYMVSFHCPAINRSLFSRRDAITMKMRKAVSLNPNPGMRGSLCDFFCVFFLFLSLLLFLLCSVV